MAIHTLDVLAKAQWVEALLKSGKRPEDLSEADFTAYRDYILVEWDDAKKALEAAKESEMALRKACVGFLFDPNKKSGTERVELGNGYEAKAVKKLNYGWVKDGDKTNVKAVDAALSRIEATGPTGALIADRLVKWTPELSLTEYKQLPDELKAIIDPVIVTTDGAPTLEIIAPKGK